MEPVSRGIDRVAVTFDEDHLVANAGLLLVATLTKRLGVQALVNAMVKLPSSRGGSPHRAGAPCQGARCSPWSTPWRPAPLTSTTSICCGQERPEGSSATR